MEWCSGVEWYRLVLWSGLVWSVGAERERERDLFQVMTGLHIQLQVEVFLPDLWSIHGHY